MTENKRFILTEQFNGLQGVTFVKDDCADVDTYYTVDGTVDLLNQFANENEELKKDATTLIYANQDYRHENEQLKKRNNNQYNQLTELWQIIEEENWEKLIAMKKQLKEDEERLQKEWVCYE